MKPIACRDLVRRFSWQAHGPLARRHHAQNAVRRCAYKSGKRSEWLKVKCAGPDWKTPAAPVRVALGRRDAYGVAFETFTPD
jgi:hypothetical protein